MNVKVSNYQPRKLNYRTKTGAGVSLKLSLNVMNAASSVLDDDETCCSLIDKHKYRHGVST